MKLKWIISALIVLLSFSAATTVQAAYDPNRGQWISRDPIGEQEGLNFNLYRYVLNDPLRLIDPLGLDPAYYNAAPDPIMPNGQLAYPPTGPDPEGIDPTVMEVGMAPVALGAGVVLAVDDPPLLLSVRQNIKIDGPGVPGQRGGSRICQLRFGSVPIIRLDYNGTSLHLNLGPGSTNLHVPIGPPGRPFLAVSNMERLEALRKAEELLKRVLEDKANLLTALDQWPTGDPADRKLLENANWHLVYIDNDTDIRSNEPGYEKAQFEELLRLCGKIQERIKSLKV